MSAHHVHFGGSRLDKSLSTIHLGEDRVLHLQRAISATEDKPFCTTQSEVEVICVRKDEDRVSAQLRLVHLAPEISHTTLSRMMDALEPNLVRWHLQFDTDRMNLEFVLTFLTRTQVEEDDTGASFMWDRSKKRRHRIIKAKSDVVTLPPRRHSFFGRVFDKIVDRAVTESSDTAWLAQITTPQGLLDPKNILHKLGSEHDTDFVMRFLQSVVGIEPDSKIPRLFARLTTKDQAREFVLQLCGFRCWTSRQHAFIMEHYGSKIQRITYGYDKQYGGIVNFRIACTSALHT